MPVPLPPAGRARLTPALGAVLAVIAPLACGDGTSPDGNAGFAGVLSAFFAPDTISPMESADVRIKLPTRADNRPFEVVTRFRGMVSGADTLTVGGQTPELSGVLFVPVGAPDGDVTMIVTIRGTTFVDTAHLYVRDRRPPQPTGSMSQAGVPPIPAPAPPDYHLVAGVRAQVLVEGFDNAAVRWLGYEFGAPFGRRDSVMIGPRDPGSTVGAAFMLDVPASAAGAAPAFTVFARDIKGNLGTRTLGTSRIYRFLDRTMGAAALDAAVRDVAYDARRERLYLSQPSQNRVAVLSLPTMTWLSPIPTPLPPAGIDLSVSGDSLLVALERTVFLGIIDLRAAAPSVDTVRLAFSPDASVAATATATNMVPWADRVRVAADGRAVVSLAHAQGFVTNDKVVTLDLATGAQAVAIRGQATPAVPLTRAGDRSTVLASGVAGANGTPGHARYDAGTHAFAALAGASPYSQVSSVASSDATGRFYLFGAFLYDGSMSLLRQVGVSSYPAVALTLSADGDDVYLASDPACGSIFGFPCSSPTQGIYLRVGRAGGEVREIVNLPENARSLLALEGGQRMIAIGATKVALLDLTEAGARPVVPAAVATAATRALVIEAPATAAPGEVRVRWRDR